MTNLHLYRALLLCLIYLFSPSLYSKNTTETVTYKNKLDNIRVKITNITSKLNKNQDKRTNVRTDLQKLEIKIAKSAKSLRQTQTKHKKSKKSLNTLNKELKELKTSLKSQRAVLSSQLRSAYAMGHEAQLKLMLNQQKPTEMGRAMMYFDYLNQARSTEINLYLSSITHKKELESDINVTFEQLKNLLDKQTRQSKELASHRNKRKRLLSKLNKDIDGQTVTLDDLEQSRNRIERLLMSLGDILADIPNAPESQRTFAQLKKQLPWPIKGKFTAQYGTSRNTGDLTWNGVLIGADYGGAVRAISHGRVVFADWLQGYGFISIIDHNDGYLSLYGHNQAQFKQAGDWVESGETIATVGDSGGQPNSGLYFEIRHLGKPINPSKWCSTKVQHLAFKEKQK